VDELQRGHIGGQDDMVEKLTKEKEDKRLTPHVAMMRPILRYLQLLCENHNRDLQVRSGVLKISNYSSLPFIRLFPPRPPLFIRAEVSCTEIVEYF
jgi:hypothetical protein